jgi:hypothetical protein
MGYSQRVAACSGVIDVYVNVNCKPITLTVAYGLP